MNDFFRTSLLVLCLAYSGSLLAVVSSPANDRGNTKELNVRSFYKINDQLLSIAAIEIKDPSFDEQQRSINFGARYSLSDNFKLGLFAAYIQNQKHNNNWVKENGVWHWNNANNKRDYNIAPEVSYRNLIRELMYEFKLRYVFSTQFNEQDTFAKINLVYNITTAWTLILSDEVKLSFTNKEKTLQEYWVYFSPFYKVNNLIQMGPLFGYSKRFWTTSDMHKTLRTDTYSTAESSVNLGLNVNFYIK